MLQHLFSFCKMHRTYFILPITFDTYTYSRVIFMLFLSRLHTLSVCLPISLRLRVLQKGPGERREKKRLLVLICHPPLPPSLSLFLYRLSEISLLDYTVRCRSSPIVYRTDARRQHHRGCPGRRFGYTVSSVGVRDPREVHSAPIVSTYRYTHGNLSQELVTIVIN